EIQESALLGIDATVNSVDWPSIVSRVFDKRIDPIAQGGEAYRRGPETPYIDVYDMHASFVDSKTISTGIAGHEQMISSTDIVIATGYPPYVPQPIAESGASYYTNDYILRLPQQPESLVIVGGGFIAWEFAHGFEALGTKVTILNRSDVLLREADADTS